MSKLLIKNASVIATMDDDRNEIINKSIYCEDGKILFQIGYKFVSQPNNNSF